MIRSIWKTRKSGMRGGAVLLALLLAVVLPAGGALASTGATANVEVPVGQSIVLEMAYDVSTVSIADPKVADAAVGSERTVVVNGKAPGVTSLVVWEEGGKHTLYQVTAVEASPPAQVMLQCKVAELLDDRVKEFGLDLTGLGSGKMVRGSLEGGLFPTKVFTPTGYPEPVGPQTDAFLNYKRDNGTFNLNASFRAMEEAGVARILASPNLVAASGDSASMLAGGEIPVPVTHSVQEGGVTVTIEWKEFGIRLMFRPTVLDSNRIRLTVTPEVSGLDETRGVHFGGFDIPSIVTRRASTTVEMNNNDVLVIGGLKQNDLIKNTQKIPILGDIPGLNLLFKHSRTEKVSRDLVIAVSPQIIRSMLRTFPAMPGDEPQQVGQAPAPKK